MAKPTTNGHKCNVCNDNHIISVSGVLLLVYFLSISCIIIEYFSRTIIIFSEL